MKKMLVIAMILSLIIVWAPVSKAETFEWYKSQMKYEEDYDRVENMIRNIGFENFEYDAGIGVSGVPSHTYAFVAADHPEIWWCRPGFDFFLGAYDFEMMLDDQKTFSKLEGQIYKKLGSLKKYGTFGKIKKIHSYVTKRLSYQTSKDDKTRSLGRILVTNKACCAGYAKLSKLLFDHYGIKSIYAYSKTHAWNYVKIGGKWYGYDATWDDSSNYEDYLLCGAMDMTDEDHQVIEKMPKISKKEWIKKVKIGKYRYKLYAYGLAEVIGKKPPKRVKTVKYSGCKFEIVR